MTDKPELKPCPFCHGTRLVRCNGAVNAREYMRCRDCGAHGPMADNRYAAIEAWNTRATPSQPDASALVEAVRDAAKNAEVRRVGVLLHATDWLALMDALSAWEAQHG